MLETEWYYLPDKGEVMVNVTDLYGSDLDEVLNEIAKEYRCTGDVEHFTDTCDGEISEWMFLLGATRLPTGSNGTTPGFTGSALQ